MWKWVVEKMWLRLMPKIDALVDNSIAKHKHQESTCTKCGMLYVSGGRAVRNDNLITNYTAKSFFDYYGIRPTAYESSDTYCPRCWPAEQDRLKLAEWAKAHPEAAAQCKAKWDKEKK